MPTGGGIRGLIQAGFCAWGVDLLSGLGVGGRSEYLTA